MAESDPKLLLLNLFTIKGTKQGKEQTIPVLGVFPVLRVKTLFWISPAWFSSQPFEVKLLNLYLVTLYPLTVFNKSLAAALFLK